MVGMPYFRIRAMKNFFYVAVVMTLHASILESYCMVSDKGGTCLSDGNLVTPPTRRLYFSRRPGQ